MSIWAPVVAALGASALTGIFGLAGIWWQQRRAELERRDALLKRYLAQLQDAYESLWFRLRNLAYERADIATDPDYLVRTTMYTLGRTLGIERMLSLEGLYPDIWRGFPSLEGILVPRVVDSAVEATTAKRRELQQYDRIGLAEATVERDGEGFRQSTFLEFRRRVDGEAAETDWWIPARESIGALVNSRDAVAPLMKAVKTLAHALSGVTNIRSQVANEPEDTPSAASLK